MTILSKSEADDEGVGAAVDDEGVGARVGAPEILGFGTVDGARVGSDFELFIGGGLCARDGVDGREPDGLIGRPGCVLRERSERLCICDGVVDGVGTGVGGRMGATWGIGMAGVVVERLVLLCDVVGFFVDVSRCN